MKPEIKEKIEQIKKGQVPQGYKKTKIGIVPSEWEVKKLEDIVIKLTEKVGNQKLETLSITAGKGFVNQAKKFGKELSGKQYVNYTVICKGDFSYNKGNSKKYPQGCIYMLENREKSAVPNVFNSFRFKEQYGNYYKHLFILGYLNKQLFKYINSGVRNDGLLNLYDSDFYSCKLPIPPLAEQQKIAEILSTQDKVIELKEKLIEEKQKQKKYLMQNLLTGKIRLKGFTGEWKKVKLGNLCNITTGKLDANAQNENGKYPFFTCARNESRIDEYAFDCEAILIAGNGDVGHTKLYSGKFNAYQRTYVLKDFVFNSFILKEYIDQYLPKKINEELQQGAMPYIKLGTLQNLSFNMPICIDEQKAIAEILSTQDKEIELLQKQLEEEKQRKKALMQLLLTGIVRV